MSAVVPTLSPPLLQKIAPIQLVDATFKANPFPFYARLRAEQPVYRAKLGRQDAWLITRYEDVMALLKDERFVKDRHNITGAKRQGEPWMPAFARPLQRNMLDLDDPDHARLRALVHKAFTPNRIEQLQGRIEAICHQLLDGMQDGMQDRMQDRMQKQRKKDLLADFALPLPLTVISQLLGIPASDQAKFHHWSQKFLKPPTTFNMLLALPALAALMRYLRQLVAERRARPCDDLLTALVQAEEAGDQLNEDELLSMVTILMIAGHETTVNLIASGTLALLQHPDQLALLRSDPSLMRNAVEELLRFTSPVEQATERFAREDVTWHGVTIPRGALTLGVLASANRDESVFEHPDQLEIRREKNRHLAFGYGVHACVGMPLARVEGQIAFRVLLERLPDLRLAVAADPLRWRATPMVRGLASLPVMF